ncbi:MAG TPA: 3-hydroxybutyrate dehydrogenase [Sphingobacteriaceae bacterium]
MKSKTAIITGSTSGIGLEIARTFALKGYNIVFNGLESDGPEIAKTIAHEFNVEYLFSEANMLNPASLKSLVKDAGNRFATIDILINNAGIQYVSPIEEFPDTMWNDIIGVNLSSAFHLIKAAWPYMKKENFGRIINIASIHGLFASEYKSAYVAAKHGIIGLTKTVALEGAPYNITCNAICPGYVRTPLVEKQIPNQAQLHSMSELDVIQKVILSKQAVKDFVPTRVIADMALFLAGENASTVTGTAMPIDGGWSAQ